MVALQIRHVPDEIRQILADRAASSGQSLQSFLLRLVTDEARRSTNLALLGRFTRRDDGSRLTANDVTRALDQARGERDTVLGAALTSER
jgi:antitoxin FitA